MLKRFALTLLCLTLSLFTLVPLQASACTDARPSGQAGNGTTNTYVTGIIGTGGPHIRVLWRYAGLGGLNDTLISFGADAGITSVANTGWPGTTAANRVTLVTPVLGGTSTGRRHFLRINGSHDLELVGPLQGLVGPQMMFRGASGMLHSVRGGVVPLASDPTQVYGTLQFLGTDNGSLLDRGVTVVSDDCDYPTGQFGSEVRNSMLARSFFPELEAITRQWWES